MIFRDIIFKFNNTFFYVNTVICLKIVAPTITTHHHTHPILIIDLQNTNNINYRSFKVHYFWRSVVLWSLQYYLCFLLNIFNIFLMFINYHRILYNQIINNHLQSTSPDNILFRTGFPAPAFRAFPAAPDVSFRPKSRPGKPPQKTAEPAGKPVRNLCKCQVKSV